MTTLTPGTYVSRTLATTMVLREDGTATLTGSGRFPEVLELDANFVTAMLESNADDWLSEDIAQLAHDLAAVPPVRIVISPEQFARLQAELEALAGELPRLAALLRETPDVFA